MNTKVNLQTILIVFILCVTVIVSTNSYANAQGGGDNNPLLENSPQSEIMFDPVPGGPGFIMVSAFDFIAYDPAYPHAYSGTGLYNPSITYSSYSAAGLTLPHGATLTKVTLYFLDNFSSNMQLILYNASVENYDFVAILSSEGAQSGNRSVSQTNISFPNVDNQNFSYFLHLSLPKNGNTNLMLKNVRIDYEYSNNLPAVMKN